MNFLIDTISIILVLTIIIAHVVNGDIQFLPHIQDRMVLQQAPHKSAVYGTMTLKISSPSPTIKAVIRDSHDGDSKKSHTISGRIVTDNLSSASWIVHLPPTTTGGNFSITVTCTHCSGTRNEISIHDVTFGDVWYCAGQSNMALPLKYTFSRNITLDRIRAGRYSNIRIYGIQTNMNPQQNWMSVTDAAVSGETTTVTKDDRQDNMIGISRRLSTNKSFISNALKKNEYERSLSSSPPLFKYSSTCYYFAESLTDLFLAKNNPSTPPPPIGLIHTAWSGSSIQQWISNETLATCSDIDQPNQDLYDRHLLPFVNMTIKGFLWYQGESNMDSVFGNARDNRGYSCALVKMIQSWRDLFSHVPGTTDPLAPFGLVTLTMAGGGQDMKDMGGMYKAQTGGYGMLPNPLMPNTFAAQGFDLDDPFMNMTCKNNHCRIRTRNADNCAGCEAYIDSVRGTPWAMGPIHPRNKKEVGDRLASAAYASVYGGGDGVYATGPVLSGCHLVNDDQLVIYFNRMLLGRDMLEVGDYYHPSNATYLQILTNASMFCLQAWPIDNTHKYEQGTYCTDDGTGRGVYTNVSSDLYHDSETWPMVPVTLGPGGSSLVVDVSGYKGRVHAVRYGWMYGNDWELGCCGYHPPTSDPCPVANCPLKGGLSALPVNPFIAKIEDGKCVCIAPQVCNERGNDRLGLSFFTQY